MSFKDIKPHVILVALFLVTISAVRFVGEPGSIAEPSIKLELPNNVGYWRGTDLFYCQNENCMAVFTSDELGGSSVCPRCNSGLDTISPAEKGILPEDTILLKKQYQNPLGEKIFVPIVVTGVQRASIHRPQWCLPGQGYTIEANRVIEVPLNNMASLRVMLLDLRKHESSSLESKRSETFAYAYWFVGKGRETPYHLQRLFWMAYDNIVRGVLQRWAYIAVATDRREGSDEHIRRITDFIAQLYPMISKD